MTRENVTDLIPVLLEKYRFDDKSKDAPLVKELIRQLVLRDKTISYSEHSFVYYLSKVFSKWGPTAKQFAEQYVKKDPESALETLRLGFLRELEDNKELLPCQSEKTTRTACMELKLRLVMLLHLVENISFKDQTSFRPTFDVTDELYFLTRDTTQVQAWINMLFGFIDGKRSFLDFCTSIPWLQKVAFFEGGYGIGEDYFDVNGLYHVLEFNGKEFPFNATHKFMVTMIKHLKDSQSDPTKFLARIKARLESFSINPNNFKKELADTTLRAVTICYVLGGNDQSLMVDAFRQVFTRERLQELQDSKFEIEIWGSHTAKNGKFELSFLNAIIKNVVLPSFEMVHVESFSELISMFPHEIMEIRSELAKIPLINNENEIEFKKIIRDALLKLVKSKPTSKQFIDGLVLILLRNSLTKETDDAIIRTLTLITEDLSTTSQHVMNVFSYTKKLDKINEKEVLKDLDALLDKLF